MAGVLIATRNSFANANLALQPCIAGHICSIAARYLPGSMPFAVEYCFLLHQLVSPLCCSDSSSFSRSLCAIFVLFSLVLLLVIKRLPFYVVIFLKCVERNRFPLELSILVERGALSRAL